MTPTFLLVRHGTTELNDPKNERLRGFSDVPLSKEGKDVIEGTRDYIRFAKFPIQRVITSPLQRAVMTASIIADNVAEVIPNNSLHPWDLGDLSGRLLKEILKDLDRLQEYPDLKAPHGESYRTFFDRWTSAVKRMQTYAEAHTDEILLGVVHSRNILALASIIGDHPIGDVPVKGGPRPGAVIRVSKPHGEWIMDVIHNPTTRNEE